MPIDVHEESITKNILDADEMTGAHVDQVWAEAVELFKAKSSLYLSKEAEKIAKREQLDHSQSDSRQGIVEDYLATLLPTNWNGLDLNQRRTFLSVGDDFSEGGTVERELVCVAEIWCECLGKEKHEMDNFKTRAINDIMKSSEDWQHHNTQKNFGLYGRQKYYSRK
jgi:putative DNA primase/helicase